MLFTPHSPCRSRFAPLAAALLWASLLMPAASRAADAGAASAGSAGSAVSAPVALEAFGGSAGLQALAGDLVARAVADPRIGHFFVRTNGPVLAEKLAQQFCQVLGGGCAYEGAEMRIAHQDMEISKADFNALVECLQQAMAARNIPFSAQNRLLARLAPMHRDVINTP